MFEIHATDFGPIKRAQVELKPLTLLIGPNNTGKSYLALLLYAVLKGLGKSAELPHSFSKSVNVDVASVLMVPALLGRLVDELEQEATEAGLSQAPRSGNSPVGAGDPSVLLRSPFSELLARGIQRSFSAPLGGLVRQGSVEGNFGLSNTALQFRCECAFDASGGIRATGLEFPVDQVREFPNDWHVEGPDAQRFKAFCGLMRYMRRVIDGVSECHYLPAARSGFLSSHKLLAEALVRRSPLVGLQPMEGSRLSGAVADFIGNLLRLEPDRAKSSELGFEIAGFLERELCGGRIEIAAGAAESSYPDIKYRAGEASYALQNCSSMVSEVAPIILCLKFQARKDDLLIIEEPESHLHPEKQRVLARAVVRMVRSGIRVLATTHSDYFVEQISNLVMLGGRPEERERMGYAEADCLDASDVGVYLFSMDDSGSGSTAEPLPCSAEEGIPEDEFGRIAEALYNEKVRLERAAMQV